MAPNHPPSRRERGALISASVACSLTRVPTVDEQRLRLARRASQLAASGAPGFTLVELLVTIAILGVLSAVVVFAVGGLQGKSQASACAADRSTLETAMETHRALHGSYVGEVDLVAAGQLRHESSMYDITLDGSGGFSLTPTAACADASEVAAASSDEVPAAAPEDATTTTSAAPATTSTSTSTTTTTTKPAVVLKALKLSGVCTDSDHWSEERAWRIKNPNQSDVPFVLDAVNATNHPGHEVVDTASPGNTTWYLPAADHGTNTATLTAAGRQATAKNTKSHC